MKAGTAAVGTDGVDREQKGRMAVVDVEAGNPSLAVDMADSGDTSRLALGSFGIAGVVVTYMGSEEEEPAEASAVDRVWEGVDCRFFRRGLCPVHALSLDLCVVHVLGLVHGLLGQCPLVALPLPPDPHKRPAFLGVHYLIPPLSRTRFAHHPHPRRTCFPFLIQHKHPP